MYCLMILLAGCGGRVPLAVFPQVPRQSHMWSDSPVRAPSRHHSGGGRSLLLCGGRPGQVHRHLRGAQPAETGQVRSHLAGHTTHKSFLWFTLISQVVDVIVHQKYVEASSTGFDIAVYKVYCLGITLMGILFLFFVSGE